MGCSGISLLMQSHLATQAQGVLCQLQPRQDTRTTGLSHRALPGKGTWGPQYRHLGHCELVLLALLCKAE